MAVQDIDAGRYLYAKQRLEYILAIDPEYPGAAERLYEINKILSVTQIP